jgi:hypothetical protein
MANEQQNPNPQRNQQQQGSQQGGQGGQGGQGTQNRPVSSIKVARAVKAASTAARTSPARVASRAALHANAISLVAAARLNGGPLLFCAKPFGA